MSKKLWNKDYILHLQGSAVSTLGDLMYSVAIGYWVYEQTGSSALMGIMSSISMFVTVFLSPFTGSIVDKCNRKWILVGMDVMQGILMLAVGLLAHFGELNVPIVLTVAFLASCGSAFYSPASGTMMLDIIPHEHLVQGQSLHSGVLGLIQLGGNAFSGVMVAFFGVPLIVVINGLSNLYSAISELFIHIPKTVQQGNPVTLKGILKDTKDAVKVVLSDPCLRIFVPGALVLNLLAAGPLTLSLPFCMEKGFTVDMYGYLLSIFMAASLVGSVLLGIFKLSPRSRFWVMAIGFFVSEVCLALAYCSTDFVVMCVFAALGACLNCMGNTVFNASLMLALPEENRGAILGFITSACTCGSALSALGYGFLGEVFPLYITFAAGSFLSLAPMLFICFHPKTRAFILTH